MVPLDSDPSLYITPGNFGTEGLSGNILFLGFCQVNSECGPNPAVDQDLVYSYLKMFLRFLPSILDINAWFKTFSLDSHLVLVLFFAPGSS